MLPRTNTHPSSAGADHGASHRAKRDLRTWLQFFLLKLCQSSQKSFNTYIPKARQGEKV